MKMICSALKDDVAGVTAAVRLRPGVTIDTVVTVRRRGRGRGWRRTCHAQVEESCRGRGNGLGGAVGYTQVQEGGREVVVVVGL